MPNSCVYHLERLRKASGLSLETISQRTKICTRYLRAIECEDFDKLPGGVFTTSYIRQYASAIGFCEGKLLQLYEQRCQAAQQTTVEMIPTKRTLLRTCVDWLMRPAAASR
jgi:cytoskeletal protein RodZ